MTPRRILLLICGLAGFAVAYFVYARFFGWLDGLPILPPRMLAPSEGTFRPQERTTSPTIELIKAAFGENAPETDSSNYPTQLEFRQTAATSVVLAAGSPPSNPESNRVTLKPFSIAVFRKARPAHLRQPGETGEISTIHADKAVLEFDRIIHTPADMNVAKLVRLELISDPEQAIEDSLHRQGRVHITNNQRSTDPKRFLTLRTVGPMFYIDQKPTPGGPTLGPDIWTDAPVEIVDRGNLPRRSQTAPIDPAARNRHLNDTFSAVWNSAEVRNPGAVADILNGNRTPPPTVTAVGMRVYLESSSPPKKQEKPAQPKPADSGSTGFSSVRRVEFLESVLMNLWVEGGQGLVGSSGVPPAPAPTSATTAILGGFAPAAHESRAMARELLQVETRGPFFYDSEKNLARFDVLPLADPNLTNDVQTTKVPAKVGTQRLLSQVLELEFSGSPTSSPPAPVQPGTPARPGAPAPALAPSQGGKLKRLHAWTQMPGRFLTVSSEADQLEAYGHDLVHEQATERTQLTGSPLYALQQRNVLHAGAEKQAAVLILEPAPIDATKPAPGAPPVAVKPERKLQATILGRGKIELYDAETNATSVTASWLTSFVQTKVRINDQELDLLTFTDDAKFDDLRSDYWLKGKVIKLWVTQSERATETAATNRPPTRGQPRRLQVLGDVSGHSADLDIEFAESLNTYIRDTTPPVELIGPVVPGTAANPMNPATPQPAPGVAQGPKQPATPVPMGPGNPGVALKEPEKAEKPKPPMKIRARTIDTWVSRYPAPKPVAPAPAKPGAAEPTSGGMKYQMENARCEGMVTVHQDPVDATKPRGTDILGSLMLIDSTPEGNVLTVFGWENRPGEVHNEGNSLIGPKVLIDQLHNLIVVEGNGSLVMPTSSDFTGAELKQAENVVVHFRDGMKFRGSLKLAEFFGKVKAVQGGSWVTCHTLQVNFDRPVYLTQANRPASAPKPGANLPAPTAPKGPKAAPPDDQPKIDVVYCYPAPADSADVAQDKEVWFTQLENDPKTGKPIKLQKLVARELTLKALARDPNGGEPYRLILAEGPGVVRTWQLSPKDESGPAAPKQPDPTVTAVPSPDDSEMKLTVVTFTGRMTAKDKGPVYQEATFLDSIRVVQVPTDDPNLKVDLYKRPDGGVLLTCSDQLVAWSYKKGTEPAQQYMWASGNSYVQNDEYDGWGETIKVEGKRVTLEGLGIIPARIKSRFKGDDNAGSKIIFDRGKNSYSVEKSIGGTLSPGGGGAVKPVQPQNPNPLQTPKPKK